MSFDPSLLRSEPLFVCLMNYKVPILDKHIQGVEIGLRRDYDFSYLPAIKVAEKATHITLDDFLIEGKPLEMGTNACYGAKIFLIMHTDNGLCVKGILDKTCDMNLPRYGPDYHNKVFCADILSVRYGPFPGKIPLVNLGQNETIQNHLKR